MKKTLAILALVLAPMLVVADTCNNWVYNQYTGKKDCVGISAESWLNTATIFGGDVSGVYNAIVVANDSHTHSSSTITGVNPSVIKPGIATISITGTASNITGNIDPSQVDLSTVTTAISAEASRAQGVEFALSLSTTANANNIAQEVIDRKAGDAAIAIATTTLHSESVATSRIDLSTVTTAINAMVPLAGGNMTGQLTTASTMTVMGSAFSVGGSTLTVANGKVGVGMAPDTGQLTVLGIIKSSGSSNSLMFGDRGNSAHAFEWYSSSDTARLHSSVSGLTAVSISTGGSVTLAGGLVGRTTAASSGNAGYYLEATAGPVNFAASGNFGTIVSLNLTPGVWKINAALLARAGTGVITGFYSIWLDTGNGLTIGKDYLPIHNSTTEASATIAGYQLVITSNTTIYVKGRAYYSSGQPDAYAHVNATLE